MHCNKEVVVESDKEVRVEFDIWDTAGQERFHSILVMQDTSGCQLAAVPQICSM